jgi:histidinol phosphatase-like enzyme
MKKICVDIDGVICHTKKNQYKLSKPNYKVIKLINNLYDDGNYIVIFTARYMGRNKDIVSKAKKQGFNLTLKQLKKWGLKFNKLLLGKPSYDLIIDDKALGFKKKWYQNFKL